jgi:3-hydroxyacyl-[acyl-carrier-protein] dehydratase
MTHQEIIEKLPFAPPFLFVDELHHVDENSVSGSFTFREDLAFFKGHFVEYPVTPGSILIETLAQIGGACLMTYLDSLEEAVEEGKMAHYATAYNVEFFKPVYPNEKVTVNAEKIFNRFGKLKFSAVMVNQNNEIVCKGMLSGIKKKV